MLSLVNPHDLLSYPRTHEEGGYTDPAWLAATTPAIGLPPTAGENLTLNKKPSAHQQILNSLAIGLGPLLTETTQLNYLNFYGNLMRKVDGQIGQLMAVFDTGDATTPGTKLLQETLIIRTSDHGENGLSHGGLRQKTFVCYEEIIHIPLVWSNPQLYPTARTTAALVSHVDLLPTLCALTGVPNWQSKGFRGVDYSSIVLNPSAAAVQDYVLFTFDDIYGGTNQEKSPEGLVDPPNRIQMIRTTDFKFARYFDGAGAAPEQQEFYDLRSNGGDYNSSSGLPLEMKNLSAWAASNFPNPPALTVVQQAARTKLTNDLATAAAARLQPRGPNAPVPPEDLKISVVRYTDESGPQVRVQITFLSRLDEVYQIQKSNDLVVWENVDAPIQGNNGPVLRSYPLVDDRAYYRLEWKAGA